MIDTLLPLNKYSYSNRTDKNNEPIDYVRTSSRLVAAKYFADRKQLPLKAFLTIFKISK